MEFPTIDEFAKEVAEKALDEILYGEKTIREWIEILVKQQPYEDCISREEAIRATYGFERYTGIDEAPYEYTESVLRDLPPVTPQQTEWIPVSERLPEMMEGSNGECSDDVLICVADDEYVTISTGFYGYYPKSKSQQGWWSMWAYGCQQLDSKYKVIAWMPLPQPYKAESEE